MPTASHPSTHQNPECKSTASSASAPASPQSPPTSFKSPVSSLLSQEADESINHSPHPTVSNSPSFKFPVSSFMSPAPCRLVVGYVSFGSRLVVGWWSVTCRLVVDWWSVMCRFLPATFGLTPCQSSPPSQNPRRNSITTPKSAPKPTTSPRPTSPIQTSPPPSSSVSSVSSVAKTKHAPIPPPAPHPLSPIHPSSFILLTSRPSSSVSSVAKTKHPPTQHWNNPFRRVNALILCTASSGFTAKWDGSGVPSVSPWCLASPPPDARPRNVIRPTVSSKVPEMTWTYKGMKE